MQTTAQAHAELMDVVKRQTPRGLVGRVVEQHSRADLGAFCTLQHVSSVIQGCTIGGLAINCRYDVSSLEPRPVSRAAWGGGYHLQPAALMSQCCSVFKTHASTGVTDLRQQALLVKFHSTRHTGCLTHVLQSYRAFVSSCCEQPHARGQRISSI